MPRACPAGSATLRGCTLTNNDTALDVLRGAHVDVSNCDFSFNCNALEFEGSGSISRNIFWGNEQALNFSNEELPALAAGLTMPHAALDDSAASPPAPAGDAAQPAAGGGHDSRSGSDAAAAVVFEGNHVRTAKHAAPPSANAELHRRKVQIDRDTALQALAILCWALEAALLVI